MIFRKTGDSLEKTDRINRVLMVLIILVTIMIVISLLSGYAGFANRLERSYTRVDGIDKIEQRISYGGICRGLDTSMNGPYGLEQGRAYGERWAYSEYYGERFLEEVWRGAGDAGQAAGAQERADKWSGYTGALSTGDADESIRKMTEVWP